MVFNWLLGRTGGRGFHPGSETFPPLNVDVIGKNLKLERRGTRDAKAGIPKSDAEGLSQAEYEVVERVREIRKMGLENYELQIGAYASRIRGARAERETVEMVAGEFKTEFEVEGRRCVNHLENAMRLVKGSHEKFEAYRVRHGTVGPPDAPKNAVFMFGIILIVFAIEVGLSGTLFAEKNTMGLVGGMGIAFIISIVNVMSCLLCGFGARYVNLRSFGSKVFGSMAILLFLGIFAALNFMVAHFRDALEVYEWDEAAFQAVIGLRENLFGIDSFKSLVVAAFGGIVSVIAFIEGLVWYDRHPGFNRTFAAAESAVSSYAKKYDQAQNQLEERYAMARDELKGHAQRMRGNIQSAVDAVGSQSTLTRRLNTFLETCDGAVNQLLARYREANTKIRSDQRPKYFDRDFRFEKYAPAEELSDINTEEAKAEIEKVERIVERGVSDILEAQKSAISAFPTVVQLKDQLPGGAAVRAPEHASPRVRDGPSIEEAY